MKDIRINILAGWLISVVLFSACSVTKHLPEGEVLYTGSKTVILNKSTTPVGETVKFSIPEEKRWLSINHRHGLAKQL